MSREEQIEGLASDIFALLRSFALSRALASLLYDKGYRKASEVAKDLFADIDKLVENNEVYFHQTDEMREEFAKLKKKYTEDGK
jgi:hypothetical protein